MISLKKLITEGQYVGSRSVLINPKSAEKILKSIPNYDKFRNHLIYRGSKSINSSRFYIVKPSRFTRKSRNTTNEYTLLIDNLPSWSEYPKRSKSIICSNSSYKAGDYTLDPDGPHIVIPISANSKIGICPENDIWFSFKNVLTNDADDLSYFNSIIRTLNNKIGGPQIVDWTWNDFIGFCDLMDTSKDKLKDLIGKKDYTSDSIKDINRLIEYIQVPELKLIDVLNDIFDPKKNEFSLIHNYHTEYNKVPEFKDEYSDKGSNEVWTDATCLLIPQYFYFKLI